MTDDDKKVNDKPENPEQLPQRESAVIAEYTVHDFSEYVATVSNLWMKCETPFWFRGQTNAEWPLVPSMFRFGDIAVETESMSSRRRREADANFDFVLHAKAVEPNFPDDDNRMAQLIVMRHHGLYSRLLDWSKSAATALFFAVELDFTGIVNIENEGIDGCVWILAPLLLNREQLGKPKFVQENHSMCSNAAECAFMHNSKESGRIFAFMPRITTLRHINQRAVFTVHGTHCAMEDLPKRGAFLVKIIIPKNNRPHILAELMASGISWDALFPDLDGLAKNINFQSDNWIHKYGKKRERTKSESNGAVVKTDDDS